MSNDQTPKQPPPPPKPPATRSVKSSVDTPAPTIKGGNAKKQI